MATLPERLYTLEEYLDLELLAEEKHEFHAGRIYAMSGGSEPHSRLIVRVASLFSLKLERCRVYDSNLKIYIEQFDRAVYPDCSVLCGEPQFWNRNKYVILNPHLVVEVLSPSTEKYDRSDKSFYYRSIPSLQHLVLVSQDQVYVDHLIREADGWKVCQFTDRDDVISALGADIQVGEIYRGILD